MTMTQSDPSAAQRRQEAEQALAAAFARARTLFASRIEEQIIRIEQCRLDLASGRAPDRALGEIEAHAHKISGVAETVGYPRVGELAAQVEALIGQGRRAGLSEIAILGEIEQELENLLDALEAALDG